MKTIAHIISTGEYSGAEKIAIEICNCLKSEYNFIYLCKSGEIEEYLKRKNINYKTYSNISELIHLLRSEPIDIVHAHDYTASLISGLFFRKKVISHIHNNTPFAKKLNLKSLLYFLISHKIEKILCVSKSVAEEMYFKNDLKNKIEITYNWINVEERFWSEEIEKSIDILFVGRFTEQKNPLLFLECIKELKESYFENIKVEMIGRGELQEKIIEYINKNNLNKNIKVLDFTIEPHKYMKAAKIFFVPSKWEGFGLVFLEAMLNKCAIVATPVGGIKEIFNNNSENLSLDKDELVKISRRLLEDDNYRKETVLRNDYILNRFEMKTNIKEIKKYYE